MKDPTLKALGGTNWSGAIVIALALLLIVLLSGCADLKDKLATTSTTPVCSALIGPIQYNSQKRASRRFAGPDLAPDLKQRNQVGQNLRCPQYR